MKILSLITLGNGVKLTFEVKQNNFNLYSGQGAFAAIAKQQKPSLLTTNLVGDLRYEDRRSPDKFGQRYIEAPYQELDMKDNPDIIEVKDRLWVEMDEPTDKDMMVTVYEVPRDDPIGQGKETTFHQSALRRQHMLLPGSYIFTFSNDQYTQLSVVFHHNKLSFEEN